MDVQLIEQTKQQIRALVNEITQISKSDIPPEDFHGEFLPRVISALAATGGALWTLDPNGSLSLAYHVNMRETKLQDDEEANKRHSRLLYKILRSGEGSLVPPHTVSEGSEEEGNPTDFLLVFGVIKTELETIGLIEILQRPDTSITTQKGYLRFLEQMTGLASDYYKNRQLRNFGDRQNLWTQLEEFTRTIHDSLDRRETAYTIVNEGRRLIECDRVSIAIRRGNRCYIEAVSGQDLLDKRSSTVKLLGKLATSVVRSNEQVWYTGDGSNLAPQVERAVDDYVDESHTKMVVVFPLVRNRLTEEEMEDPKNRKKPEPPFGAIIVEQIEDNRIPERMRKRIEIVAEHTCSALGNAIEHNNVFLMPLWKFIGKSQFLFAARTLPKTVTVTLAVIAVILALIFVKIDFYMHSPGTLEPLEKAHAYARLDGNIKRIFVTHGDKVQAGQPLIEMQSTELEVQLKRSYGTLLATNERIESIHKMMTYSAQEVSPSEMSRLNSEFLSLNVQSESERERLKLLQQQWNDLVVYAPINGEVVSWDIEQTLQGRPVVRGQQLMEIANPDSLWILELQVSEKRIGHILKYQKKIREENPNSQLSVKFVLASETGKTHYGKVISIHDRAEVRGEAGNTVLVKTALDDPESLPDFLKPGLDVSAKVYCGKAPAGYVFIHEAISWFQRTVLFWF
ncbi:MAG: efflux RND transporter periplasmic adaptor subunit [Planctomycetaceae bacterium]|nr:efflux RND transporter periplasmic adaptor subunit [Planctomycetaceae bacterium]